MLRINFNGSHFIAVAPDLLNATTMSQKEVSAVAKIIKRSIPCASIRLRNLNLMTTGAGGGFTIVFFSGVRVGVGIGATFALMTTGVGVGIGAALALMTTGVGVGVGLGCLGGIFTKVGSGFDFASAVVATPDRLEIPKPIPIESALN
jgi:hypothetical protein